MISDHAGIFCSIEEASPNVPTEQKIPGDAYCRRCGRGFCRRGSFIPEEK